MQDQERLVGNEHLATMLKTQAICGERLNQLLKQSLSGAFVLTSTIFVFLCSLSMVIIEIGKSEYSDDEMFSTFLGKLTTCISCILFISLLYANFKLNATVASSIMGSALNLLLMTIGLITINIVGIKENWVKDIGAKFLLFGQIYSCIVLIIYCLLILFYFGRILFFWQKRITKLLVEEGAIPESDIKMYRG
ncbi:hypothetical protein SNEBB_011335 [Seison nebaliae]|nr:hypothetical protein SNEBB_011335 [Seison nebaliae]